MWNAVDNINMDTTVNGFFSAGHTTATLPNQTGNTCSYHIFNVCTAAYKKGTFPRSQFRVTSILLATKSWLRCRYGMHELVETAWVVGLTMPMTERQ